MEPWIKKWTTIWVLAPLGSPGCTSFPNYTNQASLVDQYYILVASPQENLLFRRLLCAALNTGTSISHTGYNRLPRRLWEWPVLPPESLLVTLDISSRYTNIPHDKQISAWDEFLKTRTEQLTPTKYSCQKIQLILENNAFTFNGAYYLQLQGMTMGTRMAPSYANLFLGSLNKNSYRPRTGYL